MSSSIISVSSVGKRYRLGQSSSLGGFVTSALARWYRGGRSDAGASPRTPQTGRPVDDKGYLWALKDVSFDVCPGEVVGIIGRNGAGKSTLLKILSQIITPSTGQVTLAGRVSSLLEVGTGFHPELTGRENAYLNGTILGMSRREVASRFDEIVDFSGVEQYIDTPVKRYSSGMTVRLAFAVAAHLEPEILIVDEVLAVGDAEFQERCLGKMRSVASTGRTILFVSHNLGALRKLCPRSVLLQDGCVIADGDTQDVVDRYTNRQFTGHGAYIRPMNEPDQTVFRQITLEQDGRQTNLIRIDRPFSFTFGLNLHSEDRAAVSLVIENSSKTCVIHCSDEFTADPKYQSKLNRTLTVAPHTLAPGRYSVSAVLADRNVAYFDRVDHCADFEVDFVGQMSDKTSADEWLATTGPGIGSWM